VIRRVRRFTRPARKGPVAPAKLGNLAALTDILAFSVKISRAH